MAITRFPWYLFGLPTVYRVLDLHPRSVEARTIIVVCVQATKRVRVLPTPRTLLQRCYRDCKFPVKILVTRQLLLVVRKALLLVELGLRAFNYSTLKRPGLTEPSDLFGNRDRTLSDFKLTRLRPSFHKRNG
jgi:hypothetical protein